MKKLWEVEHAYYGPEGSFWANGAQQGPYCQEFETFTEFIEDGGMSASDLDMNFLYRWDWHVADPDDYGFELDDDPDFKLPGDTLELFWMMPRKGIMARSTIQVTQDDEPAVRAWLQKYADYMTRMWAPFDLATKEG